MKNKKYINGSNDFHIENIYEAYWSKVKCANEIKRVEEDTVYDRVIEGGLSKKTMIRENLNNKKE